MEFSLRGKRWSAYLGLAACVFGGAAMIAGSVEKTQAAVGLSPIEKLVIENEINQQITLYGLLADGDGKSGKDIRALVDRTLTPDAVTDIYMSNGKLVSHTVGREAIVQSTPPTPKDRPTGGRHFLVSTYFDEVTAQTARTRTTTLYLEATRNPGPGCEKDGPEACGGKVTHGVTLVYHDTWRKTAQGWQKTASTLYRDN